MATTAAALVIYRGITSCDRCGNEVSLWTDGQRAYAMTAMVFGDDGWESQVVIRRGTSVEVYCGYTPFRTTDVPCSGSATFHLDTATEGAWVPATPGRTTLVAAGEPMTDETE